LNGGNFFLLFLRLDNDINRHQKLYAPVRKPGRSKKEVPGKSRRYCLSCKSGAGAGVDKNSSETAVFQKCDFVLKYKRQSPINLDMMPMKRILIAMFIFFSSFIFFASAAAGEIYNCIDSDGNNIVTDNPQDGMKNCVLKDSDASHPPKEPAREKKKSHKSSQQYKRESDKAQKDTEAAAKEEAALLREGNRCYTQALKVISGGAVSDVYYWRICKDKNGKVISKRRL